MRQRDEVRPDCDEFDLPAYLERQCGGSELEAIERHLVGCSSCREIVAAMVVPTAHRTRPLLAAGARIDHYEIRSVLGSGGMGIVYAAWDRELEREVALKLMHPVWGAGLASSTGGLGRHLQAEAKALARVRHRNIVAVYGIGEFEGVPYIAMERVHGPNLATWLRSERRSVAEIRRVFAAVARGLQAAHAVGIVHRDLKPANVLVDLLDGSGGDGEIKVADFGVAAASRDDAQASDEGGARPGTLDYMAPEQRRGAAVDARADQYALCVSIHEALYGVLPNPSTLRSMSPAGRVPRSLRRALARGLQQDPAARFDGLDELIEALEPTGRRTSALYVGIVAGSVGLAGALLAESADEPDCLRGPTAIDAVAERVPTNERLRAYADAWNVAFREACRASFADPPEHDEDTYRARVACLHDLATRLEADVVAGLEPPPSIEPDECLRQRGRAPLFSDDPEFATEFETLQAEVDRWDFAAVEARGRSIAARAAERGNARAKATALKHVAWAAAASGRTEDADRALLAAQRAARTLRIDELDATLWIERAALTGLSRGAYREALGMLEAAEGALARAQALGSIHASGMLHLRGMILSREHRDEQALQALGEALVLLEYHEGPGGPDLPPVLAEIGEVLARPGPTYDPERARVTLERALAIVHAQHGRDHPDEIVVLAPLAVLSTALGEVERAVEHARRAVALAERHWNPAQGDVFVLRANLGRALLDVPGGQAEAGRLLTAALSRLSELYGADHPVVAETRIDWARFAMAEGRWDEAAVAIDEALVVQRRVFGDRHRMLARPLELLKECERAGGRSPGGPIRSGL